MIQARAAGVAYPNPKVLSRNAQRNSMPSSTRKMARNLVACSVMILPNAGSVLVMAIDGLLCCLPAVSAGWRLRSLAQRPPFNGSLPGIGADLDVSGRRITIPEDLPSAWWD